MKRTLTVIAAVTIFLVPTTASAASRGVYAKWTLSPSAGTAQTHSGTIKFGVRGIPNATFTVVKTKADTENVELLTGATGGDWLTAKTPFGSVFGPSGPSTRIKYLKVGENSLGQTNRTVTTINFKSAVPAGYLGIAVGDLDVDKVVIQARSAKGALLTGNHLRGLASKVPFNFCNVAANKPTSCGADTPVPAWLPTGNGGTILGNDDSSDGSAGWLRPNQSVRSIKLTFSALPEVSTHSYRTWLAVLRPPAPAKPRFTG